MSHVISLLGQDQFREDEVSRDQPIHLSSSVLSRRMNIHNRRGKGAYLHAPSDSSAIAGWAKRRHTSPGSTSGFLNSQSFQCSGINIIQASKVDPCLARGFTGCQGIHPEM